MSKALCVLMKKIALFIILSVLAGCNKPESIETFYERWLSDNYEALDKIENIVRRDDRFEKVWTVGSAVKFSIQNSNGVTIVELPEDHEIYKVLPKHNNMLYLVNEIGIFVGVGVTSKCGEFTCIVGIARFRGEKREECASESPPEEGLICISPLKGQWYLQYHYLGKIEENT